MKFKDKVRAYLGEEKDEFVLPNGSSDEFKELEKEIYAAIDDKDYAKEDFMDLIKGVGNKEWREKMKEKFKKSRKK